MSELKHGYIDIVKEIVPASGDEGGYCNEHINGNKIGYVTYDEIVKHSKNIKDLIEADDIVKYNLRGLAVTRVAVVKKYKDARNGKEHLIVEGYSLEQVKILEILAKEQFKYNCYEVKEA